MEIQRVNFALQKRRREIIYGGGSASTALVVDVAQLYPTASLLACDNAVGRVRV